ncbi:hypothetical protein CKA32_004440 [Geitlerinema sp. FC II]|nr:hypothetical protein [Geitlerinema sp. CS-897]PPT11327.1 hypothetical protein CKA32_004440 [Geitlerinema sp. FC II]
MFAGGCSCDRLFFSICFEGVAKVRRTAISNEALAVKWGSQRS